MHAAVASRLAEAGLILPAGPAALGRYVPATIAGRLVFTSGQLPMREGVLEATGLVGADITPDDGHRSAERCALNALAAASTVCDLDSVVRAVKLTVYVASAPGFTSQPIVADGASAVLAAAFGEAGAHAREAVGVAALPLGAPVEVSLVLEID
jgi:enamine deaminase RidA (YjgF/YER057c/UK114 family)